MKPSHTLTKALFHTLPPIFKALTIQARLNNKAIDNQTAFTVLFMLNTVKINSNQTIKLIKKPV